MAPTVLLVLTSLVAQRGPATREIDFARDVRPILSEHCYACHGPDAQARQANLRLDQHDAAAARRDTGVAIEPGKPERSLLIARVTSTEPDMRMPPPSSKRALNAAEIDVLRRWIAAGAEYQPHWAFRPLAAPRSPPVRAIHWPRDPLDLFVLAQLEHEQLVPQREANAVTLLRRAAFDLLGLPPSLEEADAYLADGGPDALERAIDRLLASPRFGEHFASSWLDAARFADTNGYFSDTTRQAWPWRDWAINSFNRNQPFDAFTIEQLAGDLLPQPSLDQRIATGFLRHHPVTNETGIIDEEYRVEYVADRLETTATVWLGLTLGCARCHDHKYDPFSQVEYYQLFSLFNQGPETGLVSVDDPPPVIDASRPEQRAEVERLTSLRQDLERRYQTRLDQLTSDVAAWETTAVVQPHLPADADGVHVTFESSTAVQEVGMQTREAGVVGHAGQFNAQQHLELPSATPLAADSPWTIGVWCKPTGSLNGILSKIENGDRRRGVELLWQKGRFQLHLIEAWGVQALELSTRQAWKDGDWHHFVVTYDGSRLARGVHVFVDGDPVELKVQRDALHNSITNDEPLRIGRRDTGLGYYGKLDELRILRRAARDAEVRDWYWAERLQAILTTAADQRTATQRSTLHDYFVRFRADDAMRALRDDVARAKRMEQQARASLPKALVMEDRAERRATHVLVRGQYDQRGVEVRAGLPASLASDSSATASSRLDLARWLVSSTNALVPRVAVNRFWQHCFGEGLARSTNDLGAQGEMPTHPELLDALAFDFRSHWDRKALVRRLVTSATYRQDSSATPEQRARDPENRRLARGTRYRLSAEAIRDQALAAAGLLVERIGGPSVKPYQPAGLWEAVSYDGELTYEQDEGAGLWRRSLYTFRKRQSPPPNLLAFDGVTRETCAVQRPRTNTPLQALVLLNDPTFLEAGRALARQVLAESPANDDERLDTLFRQVLTRRPAGPELVALKELLRQQRAYFAANSAKAREFLATAEHGADVAEWSAWSVVAHSLLVLDEAITRR